MAKIGFFVRSWESSQLAYELIKQGNRLVNQGHSVIGFHECISAPCLNVGFPLLDVVDGFLFNGTVVATNLSTAAKLANYPGPTRKIFYVYNLEWLGKNWPTEVWDVYRDQRLELFTRSEDYSKLISNNFNRACGVFNIEEILGENHS